MIYSAGRAYLPVISIQQAPQVHSAVMVAPALIICGRVIFGHVQPCIQDAQTFGVTR